MQIFTGKMVIKRDGQIKGLLTMLATCQEGPCSVAECLPEGLECKLLVIKGSDPMKDLDQRLWKAAANQSRLDGPMVSLDIRQTRMFMYV